MVSKKTNKRKKTLGQRIGRLGGLATKRKYGNEYFKSLVEKRWAKKREKETVDET